MVSYKQRTLGEYTELLERRADKFPLNLDLNDLRDVVRASIRKLDEVVSYPRYLILNNPPKTAVLPEDVDEIVNVKFSNEMLDPFVREFGLLPLVSRTFPLTTLENANEFLMLKGNLNMLSRHLKFAPDWAYYPPNLILNNEYHHVLVEYLPLLDADIDTEQWVLTSPEHNYIIERSWVLMNVRNAESLISASYIGVGTEYTGVLDYWNGKLKELDTQFQDGSVITYVG